MSYQVLARKWRPQSFRDMAGQTHVLQALINALDNNRLHHAYLFTGTRGVGKTTIARILAKCLNCETGISSVPCGECSACREITEGRFVDLIEIDAASRTKVEDTRDILDNVQYLPSRGRFKVYLIDEVHMLSTSSFNALLKTLEEPPAHVKFLLATTDPHKLPVTVLSRCLQFNLKNLPPEKIVDYLRTVLTQEILPFDEIALWLLARAADGSMRDALSLTDQAIAFGGERVAETAVREMLGTLDRRLIHPLLDAIIANDTQAMLASVAQLAEQNPDYNGALEELLGLLHRIAIVQAVPSALEQTPDERDRLQHLAGSLSAEDVQLYYQIGLNAQRDMPFSPDLRMGFEMALLRMLTFKPQGVLSFETLEANTVAHAQPAIEKKKTELMPPAPAAVNAPPPEPIFIHTAPNSAITTENWPALWQHIPLAGVIRNTAAHCCLDRVDGSHFLFTLEKEHAGLYDESHAQRLTDALKLYLGQNCTVTIATGTPTTITPHQHQQQKRAQLQGNAESSFRNDPTVQALIQSFSGLIIESSITTTQTEPMQATLKPIASQPIREQIA